VVDISKLEEPKKAAARPTLSAQLSSKGETLLQGALKVTVLALLMYWLLMKCNTILAQSDSRRLGETSGSAARACSEHEAHS